MVALKSLMRTVSCLEFADDLFKCSRLMRQVASVLRSGLHDWCEGWMGLVNQRLPSYLKRPRRYYRQVNVHETDVQHGALERRLLRPCWKAITCALGSWVGFRDDHWFRILKMPRYLHPSYQNLLGSDDGLLYSWKPRS